MRFAHILYIHIKSRCYHVEPTYYMCHNTSLLAVHIVRGRDLPLFCMCFAHILDTN